MAKSRNQDDATTKSEPTAKVTVADSSDVTRAKAQRLYAVYTANSDNLNYQGKPCPTWDELPDPIKSHWCAVAADGVSPNLDLLIERLATHEERSSSGGDHPIDLSAIRELKRLALLARNGEQASDEVIEA